MPDSLKPNAATGVVQDKGSFADGFLPSFLVTIVLPSVGIIVTIPIVALSTAKVGGNPPDLLWTLLQAIILLSLVVPNGLIGIRLLQRRLSASVPGFLVGILLGLVVSVPTGFVIFVLVVTFAYGAGM
jgi:hypothetical protein